MQSRRVSGPLQLISVVRCPASEDLGCVRIRWKETFNAQLLHSDILWCAERRDRRE